MTKEEKIIKAWMDLNIKTPFGICDNTGWYHGYFCNGINDIESENGKEITALINYDIDMSGVGKFRPKSLEGIETNNGWSKIERVEDLPKETDTYWFVSRITGKIMKDYFTADSKVSSFHNCQVKLYSHYQPILKPNELPIY